MRKWILPRFFTLAAVYAVLFIVMASIQFVKQDDFNRKIGTLIVSGRERMDISEEEQTEMAPGEIPIDARASVYFGGLEFMLSGEPSHRSLAFTDFDEIRRPLLPRFLTITSNSARFKLSGGNVIEFYIQNNMGYDILIINAHLAEDALSVELPYRLIKNAAISSKHQSSMIIVHHKQEFTFDRAAIDTEQALITFNHTNPVVVYRPIHSQTNFNPANYIISDAISKTFYENLVRQWRIKALSEWQKHITGTVSDEKLITAFIAESALWNNYANAVSKVPENFITGPNHTYLSSPYIGRLNEAVRSMSRAEQDRTARLEQSLLTDEGSFFTEYKALEYLLQRSKMPLVDESVSYIKSFAPDRVELSLCAGLFEGWYTYNYWYNGKENIFDPLINQAQLLISEALWKDTENLRVFIQENNEIDVFLNIRLGIALANYGEACGNSEWAAVGRSMVLSALALSDASAALPSRFSIIPLEEEIPTERLLPEHIYPYLNASDYYPHAIGAGSELLGMWLWTASPAIGPSYRNNVLEFEITFPQNSPHYLMIFGIPSFTRIQMRGMDYRSDPQFERYNSPGWVYLPAEQVLLVKLVHKTELEQIKIFF